MDAGLKYDSGRANQEQWSGSSTSNPDSSEETRNGELPKLNIQGDWDRKHMTLYKAVHKGDWPSTKYFLELDPQAKTAKISANGDTALHIAALAGHVRIVEELVYMTPMEDLGIQNYSHETALSLAAAGGVTGVARALLRKNHNLLKLRNICDIIPVVLAAQFGHEQMVHFLYSMTDDEDLSPEFPNSNQGAKLLKACMIAQIYGMPVYSLHISNISKDTGATYEGKTNQTSIVERALVRLSGPVWYILRLMVPSIKRMWDAKLKHIHVLELLNFICQQVSVMDHTQIHEIGLHEAIFNAVEHGTVEFVERMLAAYPDVVWFVDSNQRNIFLCAILQRQAKIFNLLHELGPKKNLIAASMDSDGNTMLHHAGMLSPSAHLDRISGATLQMQRELQWFKEVEQMVQPMYRELPNNNGEMARTLFTSNHKTLREEGEKWMKETATSSTVVAALVATVMFTSAFTVPGGYNESTGIPVYLHRDAFMIFMTSDALSLFASSTSVLIFLGILKSRYNEEEFLVSLPRKLIIGVFTLFFSITTMMIAFGTAIFIELHDRLSWISIPLVLLSCIPVTIFVFPQVPLVCEILVSTYGPGIFRKPKKHRFRCA